MPTNHSASTEALDHYLRSTAQGGLGASPTAFIERGAALVTPAVLKALGAMQPELRGKTAAIKDSARLRLRLEILLQYFAESAARRPQNAVARREIGFVLWYFLKGYDLIPDSVPDIGLVDDAVLVETVLHRQQASLQAHWSDCRRVWPENL